MSEKPQPRGYSARSRRQITLILLLQTLLTVVIATGLLWIGPVTARSALAGGLIYLIPNLYFAHRVLAETASGNIRKTVRDLYKSEVWKMAITMGLFGVVFVLVRPLEPFPLFGVFILMQITAWLAHIVLNQQLLR